MTDILLLIFFAALSAYLAVKNFKGILHINFFFSLYIFISFYIRGFFVIEEGYSKIFNHIGFVNNIDTLDILLTSTYVVISQLIVYKTSDWFKVGHKVADLTKSLASKSKSWPAIVVNIRNLYILLLILIPLYGFSYYKALARVIYSSTYTSSVALNEKGQIVHAAGSWIFHNISLLVTFIALYYV